MPTFLLSACLSLWVTGDASGALWTAAREPQSVVPSPWSLVDPSAAVDATRNQGLGTRNQGLGTRDAAPSSLQEYRARLLLDLGQDSRGAQDAAYDIPYEKLSERHAKKVRKVMDDVTVTVPMERVEVATRTEIYDFLLEELPFTSEVCRELGRGKYEVFRDPEVPAKEDEKEAWRHTYYMDDKEGLNVKVELVLAERFRRIYYTWGSYDLSPLPKVYGRSVIVVVWKERDGKLATESKVFAQVHSAGYKALSGLVKGLIEDTVREKSTVFVKAARWVSESAAKEPRKLYSQVKDAKEVDQEVLEEYRKRFLEKP